MRISDWSSDVCSSDLVGFASAVNDSFFVVNEMNWPMYFGINGSSQWQINAGDFMPTIDAAMNFGAPASRIANSYFSVRSEEHTSELQSLMRISYAVFCLKQKINSLNNKNTTTKAS